MPRLRYLIVVIPGILGSELRDSTGKVVWGNPTGVVRLGTDPGRLDLERDLTATGLMPTLGVIPPFRIPGYDRLVRQICNTFDHVRVDVAAPGRERDPRADVLLFPYDFRQGVAAAAERLAAEIRDRMGPAEGGVRRRVVVVGHSMGGLVARYWLGPLGGAPYCHALVTVGTPHRGVPKALAWLMNGIGVGPLRFDRATRVMRGWPSAYDLLPRYRAVLTGPLRAGSAPGDDPATRYPYELAWPEPGQREQALRAHRMHEDIEDAWDGLDVQVAPLFARGHGTLARSTLSGGALTVHKTDAEWLPNPGWLGDGTVPWFSAVPIELGERETAWRAVPERHLPMASSPAIVYLLRNLNGDSLSRVRGDRPERPWLGLELDETAPARTPVPLRARLLGAEPDEHTVVEARLTAKDGTALRLPCTPAEDGMWETTLPPLEPGAHPVKITAAGVPGADLLEVSDVVGAVEEEIA